ncbi:MAG: hypothetical protein ABIS18_08025 [Actinomycetota bacterium]
MNKRNWKWMTLVVGAATSLLVSLPGAIATDGGTHVMYIRGISNISNQCEYEWVDADTAAPGIQPVRDELGIPQPKMDPVTGAPSCRDTNLSAAGIQPAPCTLKRNTGPYHPPDRGNNLLAGETGLQPPCRGDISQTDVAGLTGCTSAGTSAVSDCGISGNTWFYGYCGQTYGGASGGFSFGGQTWTINRMGFPRGRGAWEFSGKMTSPTTGHDTTFRYYLGAAPDQPGQLLGCDGVGSLTSVTFTGTIIVPAPPVRVIRTKPGWHWCTRDDLVSIVGDGC